MTFTPCTWMLRLHDDLQFWPSYDALVCWPSLLALVCCTCMMTFTPCTCMLRLHDDLQFWPLYDALVWWPSPLALVCCACMKTFTSGPCMLRLCDDLHFWPWIMRLHDDLHSWPLYDALVWWPSLLALVCYACMMTFTSGPCTKPWMMTFTPGTHVLRLCGTLIRVVEDEWELVSEAYLLICSIDIRLWHHISVCGTFFRFARLMLHLEYSCSALAGYLDDRMCGWQDVWMAGYLDDRMCGWQGIWTTGCVDGRVFGWQDV